MFCSGAFPGGAAALDAADLLLRLNRPSAWLAPAALMTVAMMLPMQSDQLAHVRVRSLASRRVRALLLFAAAYVGLWTLILAAAALAAAVGCALLPGMGAAVPLAALGVALVWHGSRSRASLLARCGLRPPLRAFGLQAEVDVLGYGCREGWICVRLCLPVMLPAMLAGRAHLPAMAVVATLLFAERCTTHRVPRGRVGLQATGSAMIAVAAAVALLA